MSAATDRQALADAASTVDGVNVRPYFRSSTKAGDGFVALDQTVRASNGFGFVNTWQVLVVLPDGGEQGEKWADAIAPALIEAIGAEAVVQSVRPALPSFGNAGMQVLVVEATREQSN